MVHWADIQENTFCRWVNDELKRRGMHIQSLNEGFKDGVKLVNLLEIISGKKLGRYNKHPRVITQKMENLAISIQFIQNEGLRLVNIGAEDVHSGNMRIILGLIWTLILRYEINRGDNDDGDKEATNALLAWVQSKIPEQNITAFNGKNWSSGVALCALVEALRPGKCPQFASLNPEDRLDNCRLGIETAQSIGVDPLVLPEELSHPKVDKLSVMTYIAQFRNLPDLVTNASRVQAYGPGLVEGIQGQSTFFTIVVPDDVDGEIGVSAHSHTDTPVNIEVAKEQDGTLRATYVPEEVGYLAISVTLQGVDVPGSKFTATILEDESLGGEGKIFVFFSSTTSSQQSREDTHKLKNLLEAKNVHLRPDFEPWIAVDILEKDDRDAVFRKAGTRELPIVFIDDQFVGSYEQIQQLEDSSELDKLLNMKRLADEMLTPEEHMQRMMIKD